MVLCHLEKMIVAQPFVTSFHVNTANPTSALQGCKESPYTKLVTVKLIFINLIFCVKKQH